MEQAPIAQLMKKAVSPSNGLKEALGLTNLWTP